MIACVIIPYFVAAVERRENPALLKVPLVIGESASLRKVYAVSEEAAQVGVRPGMSFRQAQALCPNAKFMPATFASYRQAFQQVTAILTIFTHLIEWGNSARSKGRGKRQKTPYDFPFPSDDSLSAICYLDLENLALAQTVDILHRMCQALSEQANLIPAIGLAEGKFPARIAAASTKPGRESVILPGEEAAFLSPLPVTALPL